MAAGEATVKKALDQLKSTISVEDARMFSSTSLKDILREAREIEREQGARSDLRYMRRVEPLLELLNGYSGVIEVFCQGYAPMAFVWGPIKLMLQLASNHLSVMEKILQAFGDLADALPRLDRLQALFSEDAHVNLVLGLIYSDLTEFLQQAYKIFRRKVWHVWFPFHWGLFDRRFNRIVQRMRLHCERLDKEAAAAHFLEMRKFRDKCQLEEDAFEQETRSKMVRDVFGWLSAGEDRQEEHLHRLSDARQFGTCNWILEDPQVRSWIEDDCGDAVLWMTGIPGAGKSFLCSLVIENLQTQPHRSTLYYFCSHQSSSEETCAKILCTLAIQLLQQNMDMALLVHQAFYLKLSNRSGPAMRKLLAEVLPTTTITRIVIDGIDELDHKIQQDTLKSLIEIQKSAKSNCKLFVCSREEPSIQESLPTKIHMKLVDKTSDGLGLYIKTQVKRLQEKLPGMDSALVHRVEERLHSKAKGMFLWVRLVIATLINQMSEVQIEAASDQLPEGLDEAYGLIKTRIHAVVPASLRKRIFTILYWVCVARRPVGLHEVADGIALHPGQTLLNRKTRSSNLSADIIDPCAPLLECSGNDVLDLVHFSAKEFFLDEQSGPFVDIAKAHLSIALSCVINLTTCLEVVPGYDATVSDEVLESRVVQGRYGLQSYGHEFWAEHVLAFLEKTKDPDPAARELICALEDFSRVWKHHTQAGRSCSSEQNPLETPIGLRQLWDSPILYSFISSWLKFKAKLNEEKRNFNELGDQQQWQVKTDETYLSRIDARLNAITERLLTLNSSYLPSHIEESDLKHFRSRFKFPCRFLDCHHYYDSIGDRDSHEASHIPSFPCLQCDFSGKGFRTRKDLKKHTQKYHMSPEDFEIPSSLLAIRGKPDNGYGLNAGNSDASFSRYRAWNSKGRKALQQVFSHVLADFESQLKADEIQEQHSMKVASGGASDPGACLGSIEGFSLRKVDAIREKVERQRYESLADFNNDLRELSRGTLTSLGWSVDDNVDSKCEGQLRKALSAYPDFANLDVTEPKLGPTGASFEIASGLLEGRIESLSQLENEMANLDVTASRVRIPYWSLAEEKEFPGLLQRCGRDFPKIADHLKTKTVDEVEQHFAHLLSIGKTELLDVANLADARLQQEACTNESRIEPRLDPPAPGSNNLVHDTSGTLSQPSQRPGIQPSVYPFSMRQYFSQPPDSPDSALLQPRTPDTAQTQTDAVAEETTVTKQVKKRRPLPRAFCPDCALYKYKDGFSSEYSLEKHRSRYHTATREFWICDDISIYKSFLARCKSCSANKRYPSKHSVSTHLRNQHFNRRTSEETLQRWMRLIEEPNPNMQTPLADSVSTGKRGMKRQATEGPPTSHHTTKRQKTETTPFLLPPIKEYPNFSRTLPSTIAPAPEPRASKPVPSPRSTSSPGINLDEDDTRKPSPTSSETEPPENDVVLPDVSFDNFLPCYCSEPFSNDEGGPPHRTNRALIRPYQVPKLPHLDSFRKTACLDQVEALYYDLDNNGEHSSIYRETLEELKSLSRLLMRDLRDWRRLSGLAPNIPFSV